MTSLSEDDCLQQNLEEVAEIRTKLEQDAVTIRNLLDSKSSRFSVQLYTVYLEEQKRQLQNILKMEAILKQKAMAASLGKQ